MRYYEFMPPPEHPYRVTLVRLWWRRHCRKHGGAVVFGMVGPWLVTGSHGELRTIQRAY